MNIEEIGKISSLHDDPLEPIAGAALGEYKNYPERFDPSERSVITRAEQFGIDLKLASELLDKPVSQISWEEYSRLISEAIKARYDVIVASVFDQYMLPNKRNPNTATRKRSMLHLLESYKGMEENYGLHLIKQKGDFEDEGNLVLGLEAGAHLINSIADVRELEDHGVRLFGLQYDKETTIAGSNGLTDFGNQLVRYLLNNNLIVDLAHSGFKTRQDVMSLAEDLGSGHLICYSHGSSEDDISGLWKGKMGERLLKQEEIKRLIKIGGIVGLGISKPFFANTRYVAERIDAITQIDNGINRIAIGSDFGGVPNDLLNEIKSPEDLKKLADILSREFNLNDEDINKVIRKNARNWIQRAIS